MQRNDGLGKSSRPDGGRMEEEESKEEEDEEEEEEKQEDEEEEEEEEEDEEEEEEKVEGDGNSGIGEAEEDGAFCPQPNQLYTQSSLCCS